MKATIRKIEQFREVIPLALPDGVYTNATMGGYEVIVTIGEEKYRIYTDNGVRGFNIPCKVTIKRGDVEVETV